MEFKKILDYVNNFYRFAQETEPAKTDGASITNIDNLPTDKKIEFVVQNGQKIDPGYTDSFHYEGQHFVLGGEHGRYRHLKFKSIPTPKTQKADMHDVDKAIQHIILYIKQDPSLSELLGNKTVLKNLISDILGQKDAEGSGVNYAFGNVQVSDNETPSGRWKGGVVPLKDKRYKMEGGQQITVPYVELYKSYDSYEDGFFNWLDNLKKRGMLSAANVSHDNYVNKLMQSRYLGAVQERDASGKMVENREETMKKYLEYGEMIFSRGRAHSKNIDKALSAI